MQKTAIIIHGWEGNPNEAVLQWMKKELEKSDFEVHVPEMPDTEEPKIVPWINKIKEVIPSPDENTFFIGHSVGAQGILRYLETLPKDAKIGGAVFIAPWMELDKQTIEEEGEEVKEIAAPWVETPINWDKIKTHSKNFICILSDNDYYVPLTNKELFEENLGAKTIIEHNKGHYVPNDKVYDCPTAVNEILRVAS